MIEYLYDAVRATAGEDIALAARITDDSGEAITENCHLMLFNDSLLLETVNGAFDGDSWLFVIPAAATANLRGRYWYCICSDSVSLCFKQPIYLV